jgi:hypothetical protein
MPARLRGCLIREWGRIGRAGQVQTVPFAMVARVTGRSDNAHCGKSIPALRHDPAAPSNQRCLRPNCAPCPPSGDSPAGPPSGGHRNPNGYAATVAERGDQRAIDRGHRRPPSAAFQRSGAIRRHTVFPVEQLNHEFAHMRRTATGLAVSWLHRMENSAPAPQPRCATISGGSITILCRARPCNFQPHGSTAAANWIRSRPPSSAHL